MTTAIGDLVAAARELRRRAGAPRTATGAPLPAVLVMTDDVRTPDPLAMVAALDADCGIVLRWRDDIQRRKLASRLAEHCTARGVALLIAGDAGLARSLRAGLHLSERDAARFQKPAWVSLLTAAAHSPEALQRAATAGVDAAILSPVFATPSHPGAATLGVDGFRRLARQATVPVYGMGGITGATIDRLADSGAVGMAATGAFLPDITDESPARS